MCNELDQQVRQVAQRSAEGAVDPLPAGVRCDLGGQAHQQPAQGLGSVAFEAEKVLELADHPLDDLALAGRPAAIGLRPCPARSLFFGGAATSAAYSSGQQRSHSTPVNPLSAR